MMHRRMGGWADRRMERAVRISTAGLLVALSACHPPVRPSAGPSRDSAGIAIIESTAPLWAAGHGWVVADSPTADLRGIGSPDAALRLSDGRIVVADGAPVGLRYFGRDGR